MKRKLFLWIVTCVSFYSFTLSSFAVVDPSKEPHYQELEAMYQSISALTGVPWEYLAAIDQFERNIQRNKKKEKEQKSTDSSKANRITSIEIPVEKWGGLTNPNLQDEEVESIQFFGGIGLDGDGDGKASRSSDLDVLTSLALFLTRNGIQEDQVREQIWRYYQQPTTVDIITHIAEIYKKFGTIQLQEKHFPIPLQYNYSYRSTWGDRRGWGGLRIHEGTDIFANYGTPVLSTCYGYVELIGWNKYGGWRIGIRDPQNQYHYFAHLNGFRKGLKKGDIVKPGELIGTVGSSGYGPPGTSGKFPPHLHYGIYRFNGKSTYSYDPYPLLSKWEKNARLQRKANKN